MRVCSTEIEQKAEILSPPGPGTAAGRTAAVASASRGSPTRHFALGTPRPWSKQLFGHVRNWQPCHPGLQSGARTAFSRPQTHLPPRMSFLRRQERGSTPIHPARPAAGTNRGRKEDGGKEYGESRRRSPVLPDSFSFLPLSFLSSSVQQLSSNRRSDKCERSAAISRLAQISSFTLDTSNLGPLLRHEFCPAIRQERQGKPSAHHSTVPAFQSSISAPRLRMPGRRPQLGTENCQPGTAFQPQRTPRTQRKSTNGTSKSLALGDKSR